jgi:hypothetical protein
MGLHTPAHLDFTPDLRQALFISPIFRLERETKKRKILKIN